MWSRVHAHRLRGHLDRLEHQADHIVAGHHSPAAAGRSLVGDHTAGWDRGGLAAAVVGRESGRGSDHTDRVEGRRNLAGADDAAADVAAGKNHAEVLRSRSALEGMGLFRHTAHETAGHTAAAVHKTGPEEGNFGCSLLRSLAAAGSRRRIRSRLDPDGLDPGRRSSCDWT